MKFYYTGALLKDGWQNDVEKSLGSFISQNEVSNGLINNLFSDISLLAERKGYVETRAIVLKNTTGAAIVNAYLYQTYPTTDCKVKLEWAIGNVVDGKMDSISSMRAIPYGVTFQEPKTVGTKILLASSLAVNGMVGLWVKRTIITPPPIDSVLPIDLKDYLAALKTEENIEVTLEYN